MPTGIYARPSPIERFCEHLTISKTGCWEWRGGIIKGYGTMGIDYCHKQAHQFAYEYFKGTIPEGLEIDHLCRNHKCVNPDHLEVVTHQENCRRGECGEKTGQIQKTKTHCPKGHPYNLENTFYHVHSGGRHRECRICNKERCRQYKIRKRSK